MKMRNKGKVYPSSSSASSPFPVTSPVGDSLSVLNLLPAAILGLAVVLSLEDREVLAYMITRSIKSTNPSSSSVSDSKKKPSNTHKTPLFECDCFDCYTSYWFKWDSSPNRELIHQAIEAFEESLSNGQQSKKKTKKKERMGHRHLAGKTHTPPPELQAIQVSPEYEVAPVEERAEEGAENILYGGLNAAEEMDNAEAQPPETVVVVRGAPASQDRGLGRKVLPDVIGFLNWRLWNLWSPNV